ncbi:MAG: DUF721 domain-containing protein [Candidatus Riflebacteria bacterium]|nr:DUF721 domain-containing protein [Candidatus Riflebacteria bacterium]
MSRWKDIVGQNLLKHLRPAYLRDGVLSIEASSSGWMQEARFMESALLENLSRHAPKAGVTRLEFKPSKAKGKPERPMEGDASSKRESEAELPPLSREVEAEIDQTISRLEDPVLRQRLGRIFRLAARRQAAAVKRS